MKQARTAPPAPQLKPVNTIQKFVEINVYIATAPIVAVTRMSIIFVGDLFHRVDPLSTHVSKNHGSEEVVSPSLLNVHTPP